MYRRFISLFVCVCFICSHFQYAGAQPASGEFSLKELPVPGAMVEVSEAFAPLALKGLVVNPQKPLEFQFMVDTGRDPQNSEAVKEQANQLVKYFLAGLTIPEGDLWVNLSPYEKDRITTPSLGQTELGRDLLAQDYILKQLTASLIYPEKDLGKAFWSRVYKKAQEQFGTTDVPVNTFNKVWILPEAAQVYENGGAAYVTKSTLKVMLDEDYLAMTKNQLPTRGHVQDKNNENVSPSRLPSETALNAKAPQGQLPSALASQIIRDIVIPEITKEVNIGKNFARLRQIYDALILAKWYKETIANGLLDAVYTNKNKVAGVNLSDPTVKQQIYDRYLQAYKKGVFNYIKEDPSDLSLPQQNVGRVREGGTISRKYFSGGLTLMKIPMQRNGSLSDIKPDGAMLSLKVQLTTDSAMATNISDKKPSENYALAEAALPQGTSQEKIFELSGAITLASDLIKSQRLISNEEIERYLEMLDIERDSLVKVLVWYLASPNTLEVILSVERILTIFNAYAGKKAPSYILSEARIKAEQIRNKLERTPEGIAKTKGDVVFSKAGKRVVVPENILKQLSQRTKVARKLGVELRSKLYVKKGKVVAMIPSNSDEHTIAVVTPYARDEKTVTEKVEYFWKAMVILQYLKQLANEIKILQASSSQEHAIIQKKKELQDALEAYYQKSKNSVSISLYSVKRNTRYDLVKDLQPAFEDFIDDLNYLQSFAASWIGEYFLVSEQPKIQYDTVIDIHNHPNNIPSPPSAIDSQKGVGDIYNNDFFQGRISGLILQTPKGDELFFFYETDEKNRARYEYLYQLYWNGDENRTSGNLWSPLFRTYSPSFNEEEVLKELRKLTMNAGPNPIILDSAMSSQPASKTFNGYELAQSIQAENNLYKEIPFIQFGDALTLAHRYIEEQRNIPIKEIDSDIKASNISRDLLVEALDWFLRSGNEHQRSRAIQLIYGIYLEIKIEERTAMLIDSFKRSSKIVDDPKGQGTVDHPKGVRFNPSLLRIKKIGEVPSINDPLPDFYDFAKEFLLLEGNPRNIYKFGNALRLARELVASKDSIKFMQDLSIKIDTFETSEDFLIKALLRFLDSRNESEVLGAIDIINLIYGFRRADGSSGWDLNTAYLKAKKVLDTMNAKPNEKDGAMSSQLSSDESLSEEARRFAAQFPDSLQTIDIKGKAKELASKDIKAEVLLEILSTTSRAYSKPRQGVLIILRTREDLVLRDKLWPYLASHAYIDSSNVINVVGIEKNNNVRIQSLKTMAAIDLKRAMPYLLASLFPGSERFTDVREAVLEILGENMTSIKSSDFRGKVLDALNKSLQRDEHIDKEKVSRVLQLMTPDKVPAVTPVSVGSEENLSQDALNLANEFPSNSRSGEIRRKAKVLIQRKFAPEILLQVLSTTSRRFATSRQGVLIMLQLQKDLVPTEVIWPHLEKHAYTNAYNQRRIIGVEGNYFVRVESLRTMTAIDLKRSISYLVDFLDFRNERSVNVRENVLDIIVENIARIKAMDSQAQAVLKELENLPYFDREINNEKVKEIIRLWKTVKPQPSDQAMTSRSLPEMNLSAGAQDLIKEFPRRFEREDVEKAAEYLAATRRFDPRDLLQILATTSGDYSRARQGVLIILRKQKGIITNDVLWPLLEQHAYRGNDNYLGIYGLEENNYVRVQSLTTMAALDLERSIRYLIVSMIPRSEKITIVRDKVLGIVAQNIGNLKRLDREGKMREQLEKSYQFDSRIDKPRLFQIIQQWDSLQNPSQDFGGIDLNQININHTGKTIKVDFDPSQLDELMQGGFKGFFPVIINISPIESPLPLLGIGPEKERSYS